MSPHYKLQCCKTKAIFDDLPDENNKFLLHSPNDPQAFIKSKYYKALEIKDRFNNGIMAFSWLPKNYEFPCKSYPITYKSKALSKYLHLPNLYITYSGYNPSLSAYNTTGTFKEFEAIGVFARQGYKTDKTLLLASAGNTARAFCEIGTKCEANILVVIPHSQLDKLWTTAPKHSNIKVITVNGNYNDAIRIVQRIATFDNFIAEGGARNIGRRDALACAFLSAVCFMKKIPEHYFQAIGSGSGAIGSWEASLRLLELGIEFLELSPSTSTDSGLPKMHLCQNSPFTPIVKNWNAKSRKFIPFTEQQERQYLQEIYAPVLANNAPPYEVEGGLYDTLHSCEGRMYACSNTEGKSAGALFQELEGFSLCPSSEIALAGLIKAQQSHCIKEDDYIMLNLTGGTTEFIVKDFSLYFAQSNATLPSNPQEKEIIALLKNIDLL